MAVYVETVEGPYGPVELSRLTDEDGWNLSCHRCNLPLSKGDLAQDRGDHWHCVNHAR